MCEEGEEVPLHPMGIGQSVSQEPSGKQNQDTGDLFFMSTSLTRYPLQVLWMWILKSDLLLLVRLEKLSYLVLMASSGPKTVKKVTFD